MLKRLIIYSHFVIADILTDSLDSCMSYIGHHHTTTISETKMTVMPSMKI